MCWDSLSPAAAAVNSVGIDSSQGAADAINLTTASSENIYTYIYVCVYVSHSADLLRQALKCALIHMNVV